MRREVLGGRDVSKVARLMKTSTAIHRLVCKRTVECWASNSSASSYRRLSRAKYAHVHGWYIVVSQSHASHVQPLITTLALYHWLAVIDGITDAASAIA